jgi:hypothetical protein
MPQEHACELVSLDQVASATGHKIESDPPPLDTADKGQSLCSWTFSDQSDDNGVTLTLGPSTAAAKAQIQKERSAARHVSDLGIPAYGIEAGELGADNASLEVDAGSWFMTVEANDPQLKVAHLVPIAKAALAH